MFFLLDVHVLLWTTVVKRFTVKRTQSKNLSFNTMLFILGYCSKDQKLRVSMFFLNGKSVPFLANLQAGNVLYFQLKFYVDVLWLTTLASTLL